MERQEILDRFYFEHGPCCAGCDWWRSHNAIVGECRRSRPVAGLKRVGMIGMDCVSKTVAAGHPFTRREHHCGEFKDEFDWGSLPLAYRARVGAPRSLGKTNNDSQGS